MVRGDSLSVLSFNHFNTGVNGALGQAELCRMQVFYVSLSRILYGCNLHLDDKVLKPGASGVLALLFQ